MSRREDRHPRNETRLRRAIGIPGAVMLGLGSIIGTGIFVSVGLAAGVAGALLIPAILIAALVAACNGLSSAQLAASYPVSGGTYEYGYRTLTPALGFTAGWMFLCAKSASAATAALGLAAYLLDALGLDSESRIVPLAVAAVVAIGGLLLGGMQRSSRANAVIVSITLLSLLGFVVAAVPDALAHGVERIRSSPVPSGEGPAHALFHATALMFVAYTGYGRIATLGEEVRRPRRTIPRAIVTTLIVSMVLYLAVAGAAIAMVGAPAFAEAARTRVSALAAIAEASGWTWTRRMLSIGAVTAMTGVLLNLLLGLSRVLLAMGRRADMPRAVARLDAAGASPRIAIIVMTVIVAALVLIGDVRTTWSFSAFTVLVYYAITNAAALRLPSSRRRYPPWIAVCGLISCGLLAFQVEPTIWGSGLALIGMGLAWHAIARALARRGRDGMPGAVG